MARPSHAHYDAVVVGQGICGTALAYALGRRGKRVLALERDLAEPDKIIGELLQPGGVERLTRLGMAECLEGIDSPPILGYAVYPPNGEDPVPLGYPAQHGVRPRGRSFHHGRFIMNLRRKAREACEVFEATVTALNESSDGRVTGVTWRAGRATGTVSADMVFCCDGLFSGLREHFTSSTVKHKSKFVGLILENAASRLPFPHHGHVFCIDPSPTLIYPISSREVRVLVDVPEPVPQSLEEMKVHLLRVTAPQLPAPLKELFVEAVSKETRLRSMPAGSLHPEPIYRPGAMIVGDAMNVRNPLTGGGMSVAFNDVTVLCDTLFTLESFRDDAAVQKQLKAFYSARKQFSAQINILAQALYEVFSHPLLRKACVDYFKMGGEMVNGPMSLLGGIYPSPSYLTAHFFAVALSGTANWLIPFPWPSHVRNAAETLYTATKVILPLMNGEHLFEPSYPMRLQSKL